MKKSIMAIQYLILLLAILPFQSMVLAATNDTSLDFSYMEFVVNATKMPKEEEYDYIVVGGGTAGCPLAATLSEKYKVLILERGASPPEVPNVLTLDGFLVNLMEDDTGKTPAQKFVVEGVHNVRPRVLGGGSMINAGFYSRGDSYFYDNFGVDWDMKLVNESYKWVEDTLLFESDVEDWQLTMRKALLEANVLPDNGVTLDHLGGTKISSSTFDDFGNRHGAVQLLNHANKPNIKIAVHAYVDRVIFSDSHSSGLTAVGVSYTDAKGKSHRATVREKGEVILSAGALGSPQILLLSGVGPKKYLLSMKIDTVLHSPYVGKNVNDNPRNGVSFLSPIPLSATKLRTVGIMTNKYYVESISFPSQFYLPPPYGVFPSIAGPVELNVALIIEKIPQPLSIGTYKLASSTDVKVSPIIKFNYFSNPTDLARCVMGTRKIGEILETAALEPFKFPLANGSSAFTFVGPSLPANQSDDAAMEDFCHVSKTTMWHYHGGCVLGKVVDKNFKVKGIKGLRVVDGSTFNNSPGTNPQATVMMLGRYVGVKMLAERK